jgi:AAA family ATPase
MSNTPNTQKTLEVKIRPYSNQNNQERPDQKGASRVHLCREALLDLKLDSGQSCYLRKVDDAESERREAIAWLTTEKSLSKKVVQMSKSFQEACGFKLGDDVKISAGGAIEVASSIVLRDITAQELDTTPELGDQDRSHWEWFLRENLSRYFLSPVSRSDCLYQGEKCNPGFPNLPVPSETMSSIVTSLNALPCGS